MKREHFKFDLPETQIAQFPLAERSASRLLCMDRHSGALEDRQFADLSDLLREDDLLVVNNTRVIPARLFGNKESGGRIEILIERLTGADTCVAQIRSSKSPKPGGFLIMENGARLEVTGRTEGFYLLRSHSGPLAMLMAEQGHMPLPPYIQRPDEAMDLERYQTVYAQVAGAVAAPTAGLHFDQPLLDRLAAKGIRTTEVTLHVGAGTFQPVRTENIEDHAMHAEFLEVSQACCDAIEATRARGGRVIAVGTTAVRSLETAAAQGALRPYSGDSRLFIFPGYEYAVVDGMITNFHLPESTLLMLVCAFASTDNTLAAYRHAVTSGYRFFSYGDAMLVT